MESRLPTDILVREHRFIQKVVDGIEKILEQPDLEKALNVDELGDVVEFMRLYADKCHHGKEEELLFPALIDKGVPTQGCPVGALKGEHIRGRSIVGALAEGTELLKNGSPGGLDTIRKGLEGIVSLYPNHIWKEDFLLFPMTEKVMNLKELSKLGEKFKQFDNDWGIEKIRSYELFADEFIEKS